MNFVKMTKTDDRAPIAWTVNFTGIEYLIIYNPHTEEHFVLSEKGMVMNPQGEIIDCTSQHVTRLFYEGDRVEITLGWNIL